MRVRVGGGAGKRVVQRARGRMVKVIIPPGGVSFSAAFGAGGLEVQKGDSGSGLVVVVAGNRVPEVVKRESSPSGLVYPTASAIVSGRCTSLSSESVELEAP